VVYTRWRMQDWFIWVAIPRRAIDCLHMCYASTSNRCRPWRQFNSYGGQAIAWESWQASDEGCFTDARDSARASRHVGCAGGADRFRQSCDRVLDCVVDWWPASFVGVARRSVDGSVVSQLSEDLRSGTLARRRRDDALVHVAERSGCDSSCGETDRADGCAVHGLVVSARFYSERSCEVGSCRDKGGQ